MHKITLALIIGLIFSSHNFVFSQQNDFAKIEKNRNSRALGLFHDLNKTKDTLILKSDSKIGYVYSINREYKREIDTYIFDYECKIPLSKLSQGKHLFAVGHMSMKVVFVVRKFGDDIVETFTDYTSKVTKTIPEHSKLGIKEVGEVAIKSLNKKI